MMGSPYESAKYDLRKELLLWIASPIYSPDQ